MMMEHLHHGMELAARPAAKVVAKALLFVALLVTPVAAQRPSVHSIHGGYLPPGGIGRLQLQRGGPLGGYFQPVELRVPKGTLIAPAADGAFIQAKANSIELGMLIGNVYRFKVTRIPDREGLEVYPTVEVIDRLYPPAGQMWRFPIPIELTELELEMAIDGKFITRVIYLEDSDRPLPVAEDPNLQNWFEVPPGSDPLEVADRLGRPVAILRMGGRLPDAAGPSPDFLYHSPPWTSAEQKP